MKFKIGDKVKLKDDLVVRERYEEISFLEEMECFKGEVLTIKSINKRGNYRLNEAPFFWSPSMFELVEPIDVEFEEVRIPDEPPKAKVELYDTIRHKDFGIGTVIGFNGNDICVDFDEYNPYLHDSGGKCENGHGWYCMLKDLEKVE
ncbi:hypothetical protein A9CBEGH2_08160 [Amedibacterium intestinale]|uniref:hypothetical protein n=1 Tax=Amedibacterium intestinale TaxID=2583452 RepID=UPI0013742EC4|nr:hypothetical protein [Amedibacterium intestinale]BBK61876.1 hypothetical protein A9CBEGH2_08160 [Amedibacterium intestinale]